MKNFSLFQQLASEKEIKRKEVSQPTIKYEKYEVDVAGSTKIVSIPLRETEAFEEALIEIDTVITEDILNKLLRKHRGIRG